MNNKFSKYLTIKNGIIALVVISVLIIITTISKILININKSNFYDSVDIIFSKYDVYNENIISLFKEDDSFIFKDVNNNVVYSTKEHIDDFIFLDENTLAYSVLLENTLNNKLQYAVKILDIKSQQVEEVYNLSGKVYLCNNNGSLVIVNTELKQVFEIGDRNISSNINVKFDRVFKSNSNIVGINYFIEDDIFKTGVYLYENDGFVKKFTFNGEISYISFDFNNQNKIYITYDSPTAKSIVCEKYIKNLSNTDSGEVVHSDLRGRILSCSENNYLLDMLTNQVFLLDTDLTIKSHIGNVDTVFPLSLVKVDFVSGKLFFINKSTIVEGGI